MATDTMNIHLARSRRRNYKLLQLNSALEAAVQRNEPIQLKAFSSSSEVVVCTESDSFLLKQADHSNTVLLLEPFGTDKSGSEDHFVVTASQKFVLEPSKSVPRVDLSGIPVVKDIEEALRLNESGNTETVAQLRRRSPVSDKQFDKLWAQHGGCEIGGAACVLDSGYAASLLSTALTVMSLLNKARNAPVDLTELCREVAQRDADATPEVITAVVRKFFDEVANGQEGETGKPGVNNSFVLNESRALAAYGVLTLRTKCQNITATGDFLRLWLTALPPLVKDCNLDVSLLRGNFCRPLADRIQYFSPKSLPMDAQSRFKVLFQVQSTWDIEDLKPFIEDLIKGVSLDGFVMKYARRRKKGKQVIVMAR